MIILLSVLSAERKLNDEGGDMTEQEKLNSIKEDMKKISNGSMTDAQLIQNVKWIERNLSQSDKASVNSIVMRKELSAKDRMVLLEIYRNQLTKELKEITANENLSEM